MDDSTPITDKLKSKAWFIPSKEKDEEKDIDLKSNKKQYANMVSKDEYEIQSKLATQQSMIQMATQSVLKTIKEEKDLIKREVSLISNYDIQDFIADYESTTDENERKLKVFELIRTNSRLNTKIKENESLIKNYKTKFNDIQEDLEESEKQQEIQIEELDEKDNELDKLREQNKRETDQKISLSRRYKTLLDDHAKLDNDYMEYLNSSTSYFEFIVFVIKVVLNYYIFKIGNDVYSLIGLLIVYIINKTYNIVVVNKNKYSFFIRTSSILINVLTWIVYGICIKLYFYYLHDDNDTTEL